MWNALCLFPSICCLLFPSTGPSEKWSLMGAIGLTYLCRIYNKLKASSVHLNFPWQIMRIDSIENKHKMKKFFILIWKKMDTEQKISERTSPWTISFFNPDQMIRIWNAQKLHFVYWLLFLSSFFVCFHFRAYIKWLVGGDCDFGKQEFGCCV